MGSVEERGTFDAASFDGLLNQPWFDEFNAKLMELLALKPDWNGYGEKAIDSRCVGRVVALMSLLCPRGPAPWAVPMSDGGIQIEWHDVIWRGRSRSSIEIEVPATGAICAAAYHNDTDLCVELDVSPEDVGSEQWLELFGWFAEMSDIQDGEHVAIS